MKLREVMRSPAITCRIGTTLSDAAHLLHLHDVGSLVVLDAGGGIAGILTDRDMAVRGYGSELPASAPIDDIVTRAPHTISVEADTLDAARMMMDYGVRRLPVTKADGKLCGVVALDDLIVFVEDEGDALRRALEAQTRSDASGWSGGWDQ